MTSVFLCKTHYAMMQACQNHYELISNTSYKSASTLWIAHLGTHIWCRYIMQFRPCSAAQNKWNIRPTSAWPLGATGSICFGWNSQTATYFSAFFFKLPAHYSDNLHQALLTPQNTRQLIQTTITVGIVGNKTCLITRNKMNATIMCLLDLEI